MTNRELNHYQNYVLCDTHVHLFDQDSLEKTIQVYKDVMEHFEYERIILLGIHHSMEGDDPANNAKVLYCKDVLNEESTKRKVYAFGSILHYFDERDTAEGYLRQIEELDAMGFDGIKLLDGKPELRKKIGRPLDDAMYDLFYAYAQEKGIPIKMHLGDPESWWNPIYRANYYDETYISLEGLRKEVDGILTKFPKLKLHLAHFYFLGNRPEESIAFLEKWSNVAFDLTPGGEMFVGFSERPEEWRAFFTKYAERIYYGTDTYNMFYSDHKEDYEDGYGVGFRNNQVRRMLEWEEPFEDKYYGRLVPLHLDGESLQKIYHDNCVKLLGEPKPVNNGVAATYAHRMADFMERAVLGTASKELDAKELHNLHQVYAHFMYK